MFNFLYDYLPAKTGLRKKKLWNNQLISHFYLKVKNIKFKVNHNVFRFQYQFEY